MNASPPVAWVNVAIGIVIRDGNILISRRRSGDSFAGLWEFPGGKCEPGEAPEQTVVRELLEETTLQVEAVEALPVIEHVYPKVSVRLHPFVCRWVAGEAQALSGSEVRWIPVSTLLHYPFPDANAELLQALMRRDLSTV